MVERIFDLDRCEVLLAERQRLAVPPRLCPSGMNDTVIARRWLAIIFAPGHRAWLVSDYATSWPLQL